MLLACLVFRAAPTSLAPVVGLDAGWETAINVARQDHLKFGRDIQFTYGPWGFLDFPLAVSRVNLILGVAFTLFALIVAWFPLRATLNTFLTRNSASIAATVTLVVAMPIGGASGVLLFGIALAVMNYVGRRTNGATGWLPAFGAACAALTLQIKFSEGVFLTVIVALACLFAPAHKIRRCVEAFLVYVAATALAWVTSGQSMSDFSSWFRTSVAISSAYSEAMSTDDYPNFVGYALIFALIVTVLVYMARKGRADGWRTNAGVFAVAAVTLYLAFREGTDRHDTGHVYYFYLWAIPALAWFVAFGRSRLFRISVLVVVVAMTYSGVTVNPTLVQARWAPAVEAALKAGYQADLLTNARNTARAQYNLPPNIVAALANHPMAVDGFEDTLPWAYTFQWSPPPFFQSYYAYTEKFDRENASWLRNSADDQKILRPASTAIDYRYSLWDPPQYVLAEMCYMRPGDNTSTWLVLQKSTNRCGTPSAVSTIRTAPGQVIDVPTAGPSQIVTMSFDGDQPNILVKAGRALNKPLSPLQVNTGDPTSYRLPRELANGPLIVSVPSSVGWPTEFGGSVSFSHISFTESGTVHFSVIDVS
jgi:hypothetical protein